MCFFREIRNIVLSVKIYDLRLNYRKTKYEKLLGDLNHWSRWSHAEFGTIFDYSKQNNSCAAT